MAKTSWLQSAFNGGEFSPLLHGRVDIDKHKTALAVCSNFLPAVQGPVTRRPGSRYLTVPRADTMPVALLPYVPNVDAEYVIELTDAWFRVLDRTGVVNLGAATPYGLLTTGYGLRSIKYAQSVDVLFLAHYQHAPQRLYRTAGGGWVFEPVPFEDGPYRPVNNNANVAAYNDALLTPSATSGAAVTVTSDHGAFFLPSDVGRHIRLRHGTTWGWGVINGFISGTQVTVFVHKNFGAATAASIWRLGLWGTGEGWPRAVGFFQDRLAWAGAPGAPDQVGLSRSGNYLNNAPTETDGTVSADNAIQVTLGSSDQQTIQWLRASERGLLVGTSAGEWIVRPGSSTDGVLSPTNIAAAQSTAYGSERETPVQAGRVVVFAQRGGQSVRDLRYSFENDGFKSGDLMLYAAHLPVAGKGLGALAFQNRPRPTLWAASADAPYLFSLTYSDEENVVGWARHTLGAESSYEAVTRIESMAVLPSDGALFLAVQRRLRAATRRTIEILSPEFDAGDLTYAGLANNSWHLDCGVRVEPSGGPGLTGLSVFAGMTVSAYIDGIFVPALAVAGDGTATLGWTPAYGGVVGFDYNSDLRTLRNNAGAADGTAQGKVQRAHNVGFRLLNTQTGHYGAAFDRLFALPLAANGGDLGEHPSLFSGDVGPLVFEGDYSQESLICLRMNGGGPGTVLALWAQLHTQDR